MIAYSIAVFVVVSSVAVVGVSSAASPAADETSDFAARTKADVSGTNVSRNASAGGGTASSTEDTAVLWRGFRHAWSYNHRLNRFGSWIEMDNCGPSTCSYSVNHSGASGTGPDVAAIRDAYTELSAEGVGFASGSEPITLKGPERKPGPKSQALDSSAPVTVDLSKHPELAGKDTYEVLLNGFDIRSKGLAAKVIDFEVGVTSVTKRDGKLHFDVEYRLLMDCDSFECKGQVPGPNKLRGGKAVQQLNYRMDVHFLVIGGDRGQFNVVRGNTLSNSYNWDNCKNNGAPGKTNSDGFKLTPPPLSDNGFPGNRMWCEASGNRELDYKNYWKRTTLSGKAARPWDRRSPGRPQKPGYSVGTVGLKRISVDMDHEAHFVQFDSVVGGSYDRVRGTYDLRALPFLKEWSSRPGMFQKARLAYGFEGKATVGLQPVFIQIKEGCKRSFVSGDELKWKGKGAIPTTSAATESDVHEFSFGDTWHGYHDRGTLCEWPDRPNRWPYQHEAAVDALDVGAMPNEFPIRDGYPPGVPKTSTGTRIDLWDEVSLNSDNEAERVVQDPTQLRGRASDRIASNPAVGKPEANLSKLELTVESSETKFRWTGKKTIDLSGQTHRGPDDVLVKEPGIYVEPGKRFSEIEIVNPVGKYDLRMYVHAGEPEPEELPGNRTISMSRLGAPTLKHYQDDDTTLELILSCPDRSCQTSTVNVPIRNPTMLEPDSPNAVVDTDLIRAASERSEDDVYEVTLKKGERIANASVRDGPGLSVTLEDRTGRELKTAPNGDSLYTNTTTTGTYYLDVHGPGVVDSYTLNLTTQFVSQKYEENDDRGSAYDLDRRIGINTQQTKLRRHRGDNSWCTRTQRGGTGSGTTGSTGTSPATGSTTKTCPRHDWTEALKDVSGYSPGDPDFFNVTLGRNERVSVDVEDERLGIQLLKPVQGGAILVDELPPNTPGSTLKHIVSDPGTYLIEVTGDENVPRHEFTVRWIRGAGLDKFEANDEPSSATSVSAPTGDQTKRYTLLSLAGSDDDYFAVSLSRGDSLNATLAHMKTPANINLSVVTPTGDVVRGRDVTNTFVTETSGHHRKRVTHDANTSGTHYVRVSADGEASLYYNLSINTSKAEQPPAFSWRPDERFEFEGFEPGRWEYRDVPTPEEIARANRIDDIGFKPDVPIDGLGVGVAVSVERPTGLPALERPRALVSSYLRVDSTREYEGSTRIRASVSRATLRKHGADEDDLSVFRHPGPESDGGWTELETRVIESDDEQVRIQAEADGMSVYVVGIVPNPIADSFEEHRDLYNRNLDRVPVIIRSTFADERINVEIETESGEVRTVGVVMDGERVGEVHESGLEDPTLVVETSERTVQRIHDSSRPGETARNAFEEGRISYHGVGLVNAIKYTALKLVVGVMRFLGESFGIGPFA